MGWKRITFYRQIEKMADKITIEEFEVCHNLACDIQFIWPLLDRKFIHMSHIVSCDEFVIFIDYDQNLFGGKINSFVQKVTSMAEWTKMWRCRWKVHCTLVYDDLKVPSYSNFPDQVQIVITSDLKKWH